MKRLKRKQCTFTSVTSDLLKVYLHTFAHAAITYCDHSTSTCACQSLDILLPPELQSYDHSYSSRDALSYTTKYSYHMVSTACTTCPPSTCTLTIRPSLLYHRSTGSRSYKAAQASYLHEKLQYTWLLRDLFRDQHAVFSRGPSRHTKTHFHIGRGKRHPFKRALEATMVHIAVIA